MMKTFSRFALLLSFIASPAFAQQNAAPDTSAPLTFMDSKLFDGRLSKELATGKDTVEVEISGKVSLNSLPGRIDKWITVVGEHGKLEVKPADNAPKSRSFFGIASTIYSFIESVRSESVFEPATQYNATVYFRKDASGDSLIDRIIFTKKKK